jgi:hypothetical protein
MKPTPVVIRNFIRYLRSIFPPSFDFQIIGIDINDRESVKRFLIQECEDLTYHECLKKITKTYEAVIQKRYDYIGEIQRQMSYYLGTVYVSEAFKKLYKKYKEGIVDLLLSEDHQELSIIEDYLSAKYGCVDFDIRRLMSLIELKIMTQFIEGGGLELFVEQMASYFKLRPAQSRLELFDYAHNLGVASTQNDYYLICITQYFGETFEGSLITSSDKPFMLINFRNLRYAIIE